MTHLSTKVVNTVANNPFRSEKTGHISRTKIAAGNLFLYLATPAGVVPRRSPELTLLAIRVAPRRGVSKM